MRNVWEVTIRLGWILGLGLVALLVALTITLAVLAWINPISIWTFVMGVGAVIAIAFAIRLLYQLWGLINASYEMDRNAVVIHWGNIHYQIPMASVQAVFSGRELEGLRMRLGIRWPGHYVGFGEALDVGPILFYATKSRDHQVIIRTQGMAYAISPDDLEEFLLAFKERLAMGPTQQVEEHSEHPAFLDWKIWRDRTAMITLVGSTLLLTLLVGLLCWRYPYLPQEVALRFTAQGTPLLVAGTARVFYLPLMGFIFLLLNSLLGLWFYHRERVACYVLWIASLVIQSSLWTAVLTILLRQ